VVVSIVAAVGSAAFIVLAVVVISLVRQVARLSSSLAETNQALRPILEEIRREADRAGTRLQKLGDREDAGRVGRRSSR
jgi:uncharacterized protein YoxC